MNFYIFGTLKIDKEYSELDVKKLIPVGTFGLDDGFYGGRCTHIAETGGDIYLVWDGRVVPGERVVDTGAIKLDNIPPRFIKQLLDRRKIPHEKKDNKDELIAKLSR